MENRRCQGKEKEYLTRSEQETFLLAKNLAQSFKGKEIVLLRGELGSGKTIFAKGLAAGLGVKDVHQVCSPSFTLVNIYQGKCLIFHIDLYRLAKDSEILDLGWEDYLDQGVIIVEWAEKIKFKLEAIQVEIEFGEDDQRRIKVCY